jgi:hypothetical protein
VTDRSLESAHVRRVSARPVDASVHRLLALDRATGATIVSSPASFAELQALSFADGRVYAEDLAAIYGFNAALHPLWTYALADDPSLFSAPGDGSLYVNDEDDTGNGSSPQCMEKVSGTTGHQTARNCGPNDSIPPTAAGSTVVGSDTAKLFAFRASDFGVR